METTKSSKTKTKNTQIKTAKSSAKQPVKAKSNAAKDLQDLFEDELKDMYGAEKALLKAIPKMAKNATSPQLAKALTDHLTETEQQVKRVEQAFKAIGKKAQAKKCLAMEGLIKEGEEIMKSAQIGDVRDAGIISAAQKIEHYEIASYGTLCSFARLLGETEAENILQMILDQEYNADKKLTEVSTTINPKARSNGSTTNNKTASSASAVKKTSASKSGTASKTAAKSTAAKKSGTSTAKKPGTSSTRKTSK